MRPLFSGELRSFAPSGGLKLLIGGGIGRLRKSFILDHCKLVGQAAHKTFLFLFRITHRIILVFLISSALPPTLATIGLYSLEFCGVERAAELNREAESKWLAQRLGLEWAPEDAP